MPRVKAWPTVHVMFQKNTVTVQAAYHTPFEKIALNRKELTRIRIRCLPDLR